MRHPAPVAGKSPVSTKNSFTVTEAEAGQKLLQCLARRLADTADNDDVSLHSQSDVSLHSQSDVSLHRWIRTGQVRVNGGRKKAFDRLALGDEVRVPPFAVLRQTVDTKDSHNLVSALRLDIVDETPDVLIIRKPAGLPVHPGTNHTDSVVTRLEQAFAKADFVPAPVHRLDKDTSGLLVVARRYEALRDLNRAFAERTIHKEYLAWCVGQWPYDEPQRLEDSLAKLGPTNHERMQTSADGKLAALTATPLLRRRESSLLLITLHTGRTHQIRAQLALRGHPIAGDGKYGGKKAILAGTPLMLHAFRLHAGDMGWSLVPDWTGPWRVEERYLPYTLPPARRPSP